MAKSIRDISKKLETRGRKKTTGSGEPVLLRLHPPLLANLDKWIIDQQDAPSRPEAIRRLVERALADKGATSSPIREPARHAKAGQAAELASRAVEQKTDKSQPVDEQKSRRRALIRGPKEFRDIREDQPKRKG